MMRHNIFGGTHSLDFHSAQLHKNFLIRYNIISRRIPTSHDVMKSVKISRKEIFVSSDYVTENIEDGADICWGWEVCSPEFWDSELIGR